MHLEAQIVGVVEKPSGWTTIETDGRPQYLSTKKPDLITEARQLMRDGEVVIIEYTERDGRNINPNTGLPYKDRYYEGAVAGRNGSSRREPEPEREFARERASEHREPERRPGGSIDWRIALSVGAKLAVQTMPLMPAEQRTFDIQKQIALAWAQFLTDTPKPEPASADPYDDIPYRHTIDGFQ